MTRTFDPWVGSRYWGEGFKGLRVLLLGESHYGEPGAETRDFTKEVVVYWGQQKRHRFFTGALRLVAGLDAGTSVSDECRKEFWDSVASYNYVQTFVSGAARVRPTSEHWAAASDFLLATLGELQPHLVVILGKELARNLPQLPPGIVSCVVQHPSSSVRYADFKPTVEAAFVAASNGT